MPPEITKASIHNTRSDERFEVHFNPENLQYTITNTVRNTGATPVPGQVDLVEALGGEGRSVTGEAPAATSRGGAVTGPAQAPVDTDPDSAPF